MNKFVIILLTVVMAFPAIAGELCFSPVKEREGDKSTKRSFFQSFDYKIQVDDGPVIKPSSENSTPYIVDTDSPLVKIWLGGKVVETFRVQNVWLDEGRNCIFFKNLYETWSVVEAWQAKKLCSCSNE
jgi:frataxin-like iron-binding protein CyaY